MTTKELIQKCIDKDSKAWDEFIRRYKDLVAWAVRYKLKKLDVQLSKSESHDIVQEIFLSIWEKDKLLAVRNTVCLKSWLVMVSLNGTLSYYRKYVFRNPKNTLSLDENIFPEEPGITLGSVLPSPKLNTARMLESRELRKVLDSRLSEFNPKQQLVLKLNLYHGKKQKDISAITNIPEGTVASIIKRAKGRLRDGLKGMLDT